MSPGSPSQVAPYFDSSYLEDEQIHIDLEITPGTVGENTFNVNLYDHEGVPIEDASLIRLRFENESAGIDESRSSHLQVARYFHFRGAFASERKKSAGPRNSLSGGMVVDPSLLERMTASV